MQTTDIRKGTEIEIDGVPFHVVEHQFVKPGKGQSFTLCRIRNITKGYVVVRTWKSGESVELADVETRKDDLLVEAESDTYVFMETTTKATKSTSRGTSSATSRASCPRASRSPSRSTTAMRSPSISRRTW